MFKNKYKKQPLTIHIGQRGADGQTYLLFRNLQLLPGVNGVRAQPIERLDFLVPRAAAKLLGGDAPEGVALDHGVGFISWRG